MVAGGRLLESALTTVKMLRDYGCKLPFEMWHKRGEISSAQMVLVRSFGVMPMVFEDHVPDSELQPVESNVGPRLFQLKSLAVLHSAFEELLLLDADNTPVRNVEYLFEHETYMRAHVVLWPDYWKTSADNPIWTIIDRAPTDDWEQDSGQFMINKRKAWAEVNLLVHFSSGFYMQLINGEKDSLRYVCHALGSGCHMIEARVVPVGMLKPNGRLCGHTLLQHDFDGQALFVHHNMVKTRAGSVGVNFKHMMGPINDLTMPVRAVPTMSLNITDSSRLNCFEMQGVMHPYFDDAVRTAHSGLSMWSELFISTINLVSDDLQTLK